MVCFWTVLPSPSLVVVARVVVVAGTVTTGATATVRGVVMTVVAYGGPMVVYAGFSRSSYASRLCRY